MFSDKRIDDVFKIFGEIKRIERNPQVVCDAAGIECISNRTAALVSDLR
jgi:hypothetical protein